MTKKELPDEDATRERLERLSRLPQAQANFNPGYSRFIRRMRLALPLAALAIAAVVFTWSSFNDESLKPMKEPPGAVSISKNELINPRFESKDEKNQPYTISAQRAVRGKENESLVLLEKPMADMLLTSGHWVAIEAEKGFFQRDSKQLSLTGNVRLFQDQGYEMQMAQLDIDMDKNTARSAVKVQGHGPAGTLEAEGLQADENTGVLSFIGPARLVLNRSASGSGLDIFHE